MDVRARQRVMTEFLAAKGCGPIAFHRCQRSVYGNVTDVSSVRRCLRRFKSGENDTGDRSVIGHPATAVMKETKGKFEALIMYGCRIMTNELCTAIGIRKPEAIDIVGEFGYRKVCVK